VLLLSGTALVAQQSSQSSPEIVYEKFAKGVTPPKAVFQPNPEYAESARKKKIQGEVELSMIVTAEGTVRDATVTKSLDKDLDKKALEAVAKWKFEPATKDGKPVAIYIAATVEFRTY
jgi:periplasmic protein TonB